VPDLPETRDLFSPCDEHRVTYGTGEALLIGHDLEADILVTDDGAVVARLDDRTWLINSSRDAYSRSLTEVGNARDAFLAAAADDETHVDALEARLRDIDPAAFDAPNSYWASIVEQIRLEQF
jgi:SUKH-4 immunity protein